MAHSFRKFWQIYSYTMFTLRDAWKFFPINMVHFHSKQPHLHCKNVHKSTRHPRCSMLLSVGTCALVFLQNMHHDWKKYNQLQLGKDKSNLLQFIWQQNIFLAHVFNLKMDNFVSKVTPKKICKLYKLKQKNL